MIITKIPFYGCFSRDFCLGETCVDGEETQSARCVKDTSIDENSEATTNRVAKINTDLVKSLNISKILFYGRLWKLFLDKASVGERTPSA